VTSPSPSSCRAAPRAPSAYASRSSASGRARAPRSQSPRRARRLASSTSWSHARLTSAAFRHAATG
jgi:hypothetical protein